MLFPLYYRATWVKKGEGVKYPGTSAVAELRLYTSS